MTPLLYEVSQRWLEIVTLASVQSSLFIAAIFGVLYVCRRSPASLLRVVAILGVCKMLVPPVARFATPAQPMLQPLGNAVVSFTPAPSTPDAGTPWWPQLLFALWALGATALLATSLVRTWRLHRRADGASRIDVSRFLRAHEARADTEFFEMQSDGSPMVIGIRRHRVLLPRSWRRWSPDCVRSVLLHELAHVRRGDHWVQLAQLLALALHWFNPLAWILHRRVSHYSELACDAATIARGRLDPGAYARHLLRVAEDLGRAPQLLPARMVVPDAGRSLHERFRHVLSAPSHGRLFRVRSALLVVLLALAILPLSSNMDTVQSAAPAIAEQTTTPFRSKAKVLSATSARDDANGFVRARPVRGYAVLGRYLRCPCSVVDHSVCPRGRIVYGEDVPRRGIVVEVDVDAKGHVTAAHVVRDAGRHPDWNGARALDGVLDAAWLPARLHGEPVASRLEIAFHGGQF